MTAHVSRLAGAILLENASRFFLIGNTKEPCDWLQSGFNQPTEIDPMKNAFIELKPVGNRRAEAALPSISMSPNGHSPEALAKVMASRFLIQRNGSVSERLWRVVTGESDEAELAPETKIDATWLVEMPDGVWQVVRDAVLKCL
jgi:hypothetical protein